VCLVMLRVQSITSRGLREVDFSSIANADMILTLANSRVRLWRACKLNFHRLRRWKRIASTFAVFPCVGYSLTSSTVPPGTTIGKSDVRHETAHQPAGRVASGNHVKVASSPNFQ